MSKSKRKSGLSRFNQKPVDDCLVASPMDFLERDWHFIKRKFVLFERNYSSLSCMHACSIILAEILHSSDNSDFMDTNFFVSSNTGDGFCFGSNITGSDDIQSFWKSPAFGQLSRIAYSLQNETDWEHNFEKKAQVREALKVIYTLKFWILLKRRQLLPRLLYSIAETSYTDKNADSMYRFQNLKVPPPSLRVSIYAQYLTAHISSVFGRKTGDTQKNTLSIEGGIKNCRRKLQRLLKRFCPICLEFLLNSQNRLRSLCMSSFACLKITQNSLKKAFLSLFEYYKMRKTAILMMRSRIWFYCSSSSNANYGITKSIHKLFNNQGALF